MREHAVEDYPRYPWECASRAGSWSWNASTREFILWPRGNDQARRDAAVPETVAAGADSPRLHPRYEQGYREQIANAVGARTDCGADLVITPCIGEIQFAAEVAASERGERGLREDAAHRLEAPHHRFQIFLGRQEAGIDQRCIARIGRR